MSLDEYIDASFERFTACLDTLPETSALDGLNASVRFHHLRLDANGRTKCKDLAQNVAFHLLNYCFSTQRRAAAMTDVQKMELRHEAREFFRDGARSGEAGEMLLYFILEAALKAPQMVSKIALKTNPQVETYGSDGVHMRWHNEDELLDVFFGEAKLYGDLGDAVSSAVESIAKFHTNSMEQFELRLVSRHFKHADGKLKDEVLKYVKRGTSAETVRVNHACLFGYNWEQYESIPQATLQVMLKALTKQYLAERPKILSLLQSRFAQFRAKRLRFEIIMLPFQSVDEFRAAFADAL